jgi:hypothetical protein
MMFPVMEAQMKAAGHDATAQGVIAKSVVALPTIPVGKPPGTVTRERPGFFTRGLPRTSPRKRLELLVPLLDTQNGLVPLKAIPHGFISVGSWIGANPGMSDIKLVCR